MEDSTRQRWTTQRFIHLAVLLILAAIVLAPLLYMFITSLRTRSDILKNYASFVPSPVTGVNYQKIFNDPQAPVGRWFLNSFIAVAGATFLVLLVDSLAAYALSRLHFPGRDAIFYAILSSMLIPGVVLIIPLYAEFANANLINTYWPLILPYASGVFGVFLLRQFYLGIPKELEEAAVIDGAGKLRRWTQVILPLTKTPLLTLGIFTVMGIYNDFIWPLVVTNTPEMRTITVAIALVTSGTYVADFGPLMAFTSIAALPIIALFILLQRYFVASSALSGVKG